MSATTSEGCQHRKGGTNEDIRRRLGHARIAYNKLLNYGTTHSHWAKDKDNDCLIRQT